MTNSEFPTRPEPKALLKLWMEEYPGFNPLLGRFDQASIPGEDSHVMTMTVMSVDLQVRSNLVRSINDPQLTNEEVFGHQSDVPSIE